MRGMLAVILVALMSAPVAYAEEACTVGETPILKHEKAKDAKGDGLLGVWEGGTWQSKGYCTAVAFIPNGDGSTTMIYAWNNSPDFKAGRTVDKVTPEGGTVKHRFNNSRSVTFELLPDGSLQGTMFITSRGTYTTVYTKVPDEKRVAK